MRVVAVVAAFAMLAFAGCLGDEDPISKGPTVVSSTNEATNGTVEQTVSMSLSQINGTAPLLVNFTLSATNALNGTWVLDTGDNNTLEGTGDQLPATVNHTFAAGLWNVTFAVSYANQTVQTTTQVDVAAALPTGPASGAPLTPLEFSHSDAILVGVQGCDAVEGIDHKFHAWTIPEMVDGVPARITVFDVLLTMDSPTTLDLDLDFYGPDGGLIGSSHDFNPPVPVFGTGSPTESFSAEGNYGPGDYSFKVANCSGVEGDYTILATATTVAA